MYAGLMALLFALQLGGIFAAMELRGAVVRRELQTVDVLTSLEDYGANPATRRRWDALHQEFGCCGGINFNDGYKVRLRDIAEKKGNETKINLRNSKQHLAFFRHWGGGFFSLEIGCIWIGCFFHCQFTSCGSQQFG